MKKIWILMVLVAFAGCKGSGNAKLLSAIDRADAVVVHAHKSIEPYSLPADQRPDLRRAIASAEHGGSGPRPPVALVNRIEVMKGTNVLAIIQEGGGVFEFQGQWYRDVSGSLEAVVSQPEKKD